MIPFGQVEAHVGPDYGRYQSVAVYLVHRRADGTTAIGLPADITFETIADDAIGTQHQPTLRIPNDVARALLDALARHFGGTSDTQTLRRDYLDERGRVDRLIGMLGTVIAPEPSR